MALTEPGKIITPWANAGLKNAIPDAANPVSGSAGFDLGFPPVTMTPPEAGGIPPQGQDFNGILYDITTILRFLQAGGVPSYDPSLASAVGGYNKGALVMGEGGSPLWQNNVDGNTSNPNADGAGWVNAFFQSLPKRNFSTIDYIQIPDVVGGLIIQWGFGSESVLTSKAISFPLAFPVACAFVVPVKDTSSSPRWASCSNVSQSGFTLYGWLNDNPFPPDNYRWMAIGY